MSMKNKERMGESLDAFFEAVRRETPAPSSDLLARVLTEAEALQAARARATSVSRPGMAARLYHLLGGWPVVAGLVSAALTGIWIGSGLPERLIGQAEAVYLVDITPEMAFDLAGGDF